MGTISSGIIEVKSQSDFAVIEAKVPSVSCFFSREKDLSATYNDVPLDYYVLENLKKEIPFFGFLHYEYHTAKKLLEQYDSGAVREDFRTDWDQFVTYSMWVVGEIDDVLDEMRDGGQSDWEKECHISHQKSKPVQRRKTNEVEVKPIRYAEKVQLVGTQFEGRAERIEHVHKGDTVMLVREPENPYDTNAIDVRSPEGSLGHIGAELTPRYACLLDSGSMRCEGRIAEVTPLSMRSSKCKKALVTIRVYPAKKQK